MCNQEWAQILREGLWNYSLDSSRLRVEELLEAVLIQHKCWHTNNTKHIYNMSNIKQCKIYREIELRDSGWHANTKIHFEVRATVLRPCLHTEGSTMSTQDLPQRDLHWEITTQHREYTTPLSTTQTSTQEVGNNPSTKQRRNKTWWSNNHKLFLGDLKES